jgi:hypothetical protein
MILCKLLLIKQVSPLCWSGGIGRRTRLKIWRCLTAWGFNSPLQHIKCEVSRFVAQKDDLSGLLALIV